jgi:hypothetical protein
MHGPVMDETIDSAMRKEVTPNNQGNRHKPA